MLRPVLSTPRLSGGPTITADTFYVLFSFVLGYLVGRADTIYRAVRDTYAPQPKSGFFANNAAEPGKSYTGSKISIDERTVVTDIKTDSMTKTQDLALGKQSVQQDNIGASVNKLAQLKRS